MNKDILKSKGVFAWAVVALHFVFFVLACHFRRIYNGDSFEYIYEALNIKNLLFFYSGNASLPIVPEYMSQRMPLYPLFLMLVYGITVNNWIVLILQNALSVLNILYARKLVQKIGFPQWADRILFVLILAYPSQFINANTIAPDILLQSFTLVYFGNLLALFRTHDRKHELYSGFALIAGMMVKPVLYPFLLVHIAILLANCIYSKIKIQRSIILSAIPLVLMFFYGYWNQTRTGKFHITSNQAFNALYYFQPYIRSHYGVDSGNRLLFQQRKEIAQYTQYQDRYDCALNKGRELWRENFISYSVFHLGCSLKMLFDPGKAEMDLFKGKLTYGKLYDKSKNAGGFSTMWKEKHLSGIWDYVKVNNSVFPALFVLLFNVMKLIGFFLFLKNGTRISLPVRILSLILVAYFVLIAGPIENPRYFLPVSLLYSGFAAIGIVNYCCSRHKNKALAQTQAI